MRFGFGILLSLGISATAWAAPWDEVAIAQGESAGHARQNAVSMQRGVRADALKTIDTLSLTPFAQGLGSISALAISQDGALYAADQKTGRIWVMSDRGADGSMDIKRPLTHTFNEPTGLSFIDHTLYVADKRAVWALDLEQNTPPRQLASLANAQSQGEHPLIADKNALILAVNQTSGAQLVHIDAQTGRSKNITTSETPIYSLAKLGGSAIWMGSGETLVSLNHPDAPLRFSGQSLAALILPGQYESPKDWPPALKGHIIASQLGPKAHQLIAIPTEFGVPSGAPRILLEGFVNSTGRSAWGTPGAMIMDKRGLFFADKYNGTIWRLFPKGKPTPVTAETTKVVEDIPETRVATPTKSPLLIGSGITGSQIESLSQIESASQLETGSTLLDEYEKAEAEAAKAEKEAQEQKKSKKTYRSIR